MKELSSGQANLSLTEPKHEDILDGLPLQTYESGNIVMDYFKNNEKIFVVKSGFLKQKVITSDGKSITLQILKPGEQVGLLFRYSESFSNLVVTAMTDTELYVVGSRKFSSLIKTDFQWISKGLQQLQLRLNELWDRFQSKAHYDLKTLLACQLCKLSIKFGIHRDGGLSLQHWLELQELANFTANSRESIYRCLADLRELGLVRREESIFLPEPTKLRETSDCSCDDCSPRVFHEPTK